MVSAAIHGLYNTSSRTGSGRNNGHGTTTITSYEELTKHEKKALVHILRAPHFPCTPKQREKYERKTEYLIRDLPTSMHSSDTIFNATPTAYSVISRDPSGPDGTLKRHYLCAMHKGIERKLVTSIWKMLRHELDHGIGKFIYPVIVVDGYLTAAQELAARQLEPVLRMYHHDFSVEGSTPTGKGAIDCGEKWAVQTDGCPACMLARIGEDEGVLGALIAGIVAHIGTKHAGTRDNIRSHRLRFLKSWLRDGDYLRGKRMVDQAWDLGLLIRRARKDMRRNGISATFLPSRPRPSTAGAGEADNGQGDGDSVHPQHAINVHGPEFRRFHPPNIRNSDPFDHSTRTSAPSIRHIPRGQLAHSNPSRGPRSHAASFHISNTDGGSRSRSNSSSSPSRFSQLTWNRLQEYDGRSFPSSPTIQDDDSLQPAPLRRNRANTVREQQREDAMLPRPGPGSVYGSFDGDESELDFGDD